MTTTTLSQSGSPTARRVMALVASTALVGAGVMLIVSDQALGIAVLCTGAASLAWTIAGLQDARTLALLEEVELGDLAIPLPLLPARSADPRHDIAWLPADVPALVAMPGGGWGLVAHDTAVAAADRVGFNGEWHRVAEPKTVFGARDHVPTIKRIPRGGDAALVDMERPLPHGVIGVSILDLADRRAAHLDELAEEVAVQPRHPGQGRGFRTTGRSHA